MGDLTKNSSFFEYMKSDTAKAHGLDLATFVTPEIENNIKNIMAPKFQEMRDILGCRVDIHSCFRPAVVNAFIPGSSKTSAHINGLGMDTTSFAHPVEKQFEILERHPTFMQNVDQMIIERGCVHIGMRNDEKDPRRELRKQHVGEDGKYTYPLIRVWK